MGSIAASPTRSSAPTYMGAMRLYWQLGLGLCARARYNAQAWFHVIGRDILRRIHATPKE